MQKFFSSVDEVLADELFLGWYFKKNPEREKAWEEWLKQHPEQQSLVTEARKIMAELHIRETTSISSSQVNAAHQKFISAINENETDTPVFNIRSNRRKWWMAAAAAAIIVIAGGLFWLNNGKQNDNVILATDYGQLNKDILPDGSQVILNAKSTVTLSQNFGKDKDREVWLKGEAFFHVAKTNSNQRFIVHTDKFDIIVTGTKFNAVNRDNKTSVFLEEGSVTVFTKDGEEVKMIPGDYVEIRDGKLERRETNQEAILAWKDKRLDFENITMKDAAKIITEHYGIKVTLADEAVGEKRLTGIMPNDNLDVLIRALEVAYSFEIIKSNNELIVHEK